MRRIGSNDVAIKDVKILVIEPNIIAENTADLFIEMRQKREMSPETLRRKSADVENEMQDLKKTLADLDKKTATAILPADVEKYLYGMMEKLTSDDMDVVKVLFENFIKEIIVTDDLIEIRLFSCPVMYNEANGHSDGFLYTTIYR